MGSISFPSKNLVGILIPLFFCLLSARYASSEADPGARSKDPSLFEPTAGEEPWASDLEIYESSDGLRFARKGIFVKRAGVPSLIRAKDGTIYAAFQWFPADRPEAFDRIAVVSSVDNGAVWSGPKLIVIEKMPQNLSRAFDPVLVTLSDGSFRLYFTSERVNETIPRGRHAEGGHGRAIFSARSTDGIHYAFEPGERFGFPNEETYDVSVVYFKNKWHLFCPKQGEERRAYHAVSEDGLRFETWELVEVPVAGSWIGNAVVTGDKLCFYGSGVSIWGAVSDDGSKWTLELGVNLPGGDPAVLLLPYGKFIAVTTSAPLRQETLPPPFPQTV